MIDADLESRFVACLVGGAAGDALGAAVEFMDLPAIQARFGPRGITAYAEVYGRVGAITDDTQMTLFTAEGIIRAAAAHRQGQLSDPLDVIQRAYLRWLHTQGERSAHPDYDDAIDGWLVRIPALHSRRAPGNTCLSALRLAACGRIDAPTNDSKGCGGVMRVAPAGLWGQDAFELGCTSSALTHGHPSGYLAGGLFAAMIAYAVAGASVDDAITQALSTHRPQLNDEVIRAVEQGIEAGRRGKVDGVVIESLGGGWVAEEALAITVCCALASPDDLDEALRLAVNHSGDSDSTGSMVGQLLGAALGATALEPWRHGLELQSDIAQVARDLAAAHAGEPIEPDRYPPR